MIHEPREKVVTSQMLSWTNVGQEEHLDVGLQSLAISDALVGDPASFVIVNWARLPG
jgi:hypothetical protein